MTEENDKTQEQAPAPEPSEPSSTFEVKKPQQKTVNVVGGVVIATLVAIVLAQAIGNNNQLSAEAVRFQGGPGGQFQGPGPHAQQGQGQQGMQGPRSQAPGMGPNGQGGQKRREDCDDKRDAPEGKTDEDDNNDNGDG